MVKPHLETKSTPSARSGSEQSQPSLADVPSVPRGSTQLHTRESQAQFLFPQLPEADGMNADRKRTACQRKKSPPPLRSRNKPILDLDWFFLPFPLNQHLYPILTRSNSGLFPRIKTWCGSSSNEFAFVPQAELKIPLICRVPRTMNRQ